MSEGATASDRDRSPDAVERIGGGGGFQVLLYYLYTPITDASEFTEQHRALCVELGLKGRIIIADEGLNGTVSGTVEAADRYREILKQTPGFEAITFKIDPAEGHVFPKLSVKYRSEIVSLSLPEGEDINPCETTGKRLSPKEFQKAMREDDVVILDGRNNYESDLGRFRGALCPDVASFRDFPQWIREHLGDVKDRKILTYCTGGIRCEKLSGFLVSEGFEDVSQLDGGIVSYGKDQEVRGEGFEGQCYVFDERVGVDVNRADANIVSSCRSCGRESIRYVNCCYQRCNLQIFLCEACEKESGRYCDDGCRREAEASGAVRGEGGLASR